MDARYPDLYAIGVEHLRRSSASALSLAIMDKLYMRESMPGAELRQSIMPVLLYQLLQCSRIH